MLALAPGLVRDGLGYQATLRRARVPTLYGSALVRAEGERRVERAVVARIDAAGAPWRAATAPSRWTRSASATGSSPRPNSRAQPAAVTPSTHARASSSPSRTSGTHVGRRRPGDRRWSGCRGRARRTGARHDRGARRDPQPRRQAGPRARRRRTPRAPRALEGPPLPGGAPEALSRAAAEHAARRGRHAAVSLRERLPRRHRGCAGRRRRARRRHQARHAGGHGAAARAATAARSSLYVSSREIGRPDVLSSHCFFAGGSGEAGQSRRLRGDPRDAPQTWRGF